MSEFVTLLPCSGKDWERGNSHAFSECRRKKRSWLVPFSFLLIASLGTIFVVWLLLVWERVRCQMPCREVAEKWDFSTAKLMLGKKKKKSQSLSTESCKKPKFSRVLPTGKQKQSTGKMNKNGQILFKKNDSSSMGRALCITLEPAWAKTKHLLRAVGLQPHNLPQAPGSPVGSS